MSVVLLVVAALLTRDNLRGVEACNVLADQLELGQIAAERVLSTVRDAETGQRGYLLTGNPSYLMPFESARARLDAELVQLAAEPGLSTAQVSRIGHIRELARVKMAELGHTITLQESGDTKAALAMVQTNLGKDAMDGIREEVNALHAEAAANLAEVRASSESTKWTWAAVYCLAAVACALLGGMALAERRARLRVSANLARLTQAKAELRDSELMLLQSKDRAEQAEALLRDAMNSISEGFVIYDRDDRFVMCNEAYRRLFAERADLLVPGTSFENIFVDMMGRQKNTEARDREAAILPDRLRLHREPNGSVERRQGDGSWVLATDRRMSNGGIAGLRVNITALKLSQMALARSEARLDLAQQIAGIGSWELDLVTGRATWSDELYRIRGLSPAGFQPTIDNSGTFVHPDDLAAVEQWRTDLAAGIDPGAIETRNIRPNGEVRLLRVEGRAVTDADGVIRQLVGTMQDVTELRLMQGQLAQSQKMEAIGNLTGGMAHDFNNGLGIIIGNLDLLSRRIQGDTLATELCDDARDGALRCADLTRLLLAFARQQPLHPVRLDVNELIVRTVRLLSRTLGEDIVLRSNPGKGIWSVVADPAQLEAALTNLANNARDAMSRGGRLDITTQTAELDEHYAALHPEVTPGLYVLIEVTDTGSGIAPENIGSIFDPFFTTKEPGQGTGLGLSMVFGFVKQSGGHLAVYSEPGRGTTFRIYLPRARPTDPEAASPIKRPLIVGGTENVLVVEDNAPLLRATVRQLTELGYHTIEAEHAAAALAILTSAAPVDLLFTDVVMPGGMDGIDLANQGILLRPGLKVILTSGFPGAHRGLTDRRIADCPFPMLNKPCRHEDLARTLRAVLDSDADQTAGGANPDALPVLAD